MGGHHPLGDAAGARGENQASDVVRRQFGDLPGNVVRLITPARQNLVPRQNVDRARLAGDGLDRDHRVHGVDLVGRRQHSPGQRGLGDDHGAGAAGRKDMAMVLDGVRHIGRDRDRPSAHHREIGDDPFRPVLRHQGDPLPRDDAKRSQTLRQPADVACRQRPCYRLIVPVSLHPQKRLVAEPAGLFEEHRRKAGPIVVIHPSATSPPPFYGFRARSWNSACRRLVVIPT